MYNSSDNHINLSQGSVSNGYKVSLRFLVLTLVLSLLLFGCRASVSQESTTLRLALLPILDTLPMYVAQEQGYFEEEGVTVEFVPVSSAAERDQLIKAGQADGMINEILSTLFYNSQEPEILVVRYARVATPDFPQFYILAAPGSDVANPEDLAGKEIGISEGTIIEYSTDRLLQAAGMSPEDVETVAVPSIADRMSLLNSGELAAANLPDPLASLAIQNGATIVIDDSSYPLYGHSVISFRKEVVDDSPEAVRGFLAALERAVDDINGDKEQWGTLLSEQGLVPEPLVGSYTIPDFPSASVPPQSQWDDVVEWAKTKGYVAGDPNYADSIDDSFLP